jgi:chaperone required for assembly of F1-ATPase
MKRFYTEVAVETEEAGFLITLDGKRLRSAGGGPLPLPTEALANALALEWRSQGDILVPHTMPLMQLASTTADWTIPKRPEAVAAVARYGGSDLLCYRATSPRELVERQQMAWDPLLDWLAERHGARLIVTSGIVPVAQPPLALQALERAVEALDPFALTTLRVWTAGAGSLVLGLALIGGRLDSEAAWALADIDGAYQRGQWGEEEEAGRRLAELRADLRVATRFWQLAAPTAGS